MSYFRLDIGRDTVVSTGEDIAFPIEFFEDPELDTPTDLTGRTFEAEIRNALDVVVETFDITGADTGGELVLRIPRARSSALRPGVYQYDLLETTGGAHTYLLGGEVALRRGNTRG